MAPMPCTQQGFGILHTVSSSYIYQVRSARTSLSRFPAAVSLLLIVPNDDSGILSVIPSALFISKAVRGIGSLLLSFAGGDTASLVGPSHSDAAWAAVHTTERDLQEVFSFWYFPHRCSRRRFSSCVLVAKTVTAISTCACIVQDFVSTQTSSWRA